MFSVDQILRSARLRPFLIIAFIFVVFQIIGIEFFIFFNSTKEVAKEEEVKFIVPVVQLYFARNESECPTFILQSLWQSKQYNEEVILLSTSDECEHFCNEHGIKFVPLSIHFDEAQQFDEFFYPNLKHWKSRRWFEIKSFQRWFALRDYMKRNNIQQMFYCDSDVLLYSNMTELWLKYFNEFHLSISTDGIISGFVGFWTYRGIDNYCKYMQLYYKNNLHPDFNDGDKWYQKNNDMFILQRYARKLDNIRGVDYFPYSSLTEKFDDSYFLNNLVRDQEDYLVTSDGMKAIVWEEEHPHLQYKANNTRIKLHGIHFQGTKFKHLLPWYLRQRLAWHDKEECICKNVWCDNCWIVPKKPIEIKL